MSKEITDRQQEIFDFIQEFVEFNGYPPTYREIGSHFGIASTFGVKRHIDALIKKGFLLTGNNTSRTIQIVDNQDKTTIPIIGRVAAGSPILAQENIEGSILVDPSLIKYGTDVFGLRVKGDSMINAGIMENDIVVVNSQNNANNSEIVVAMIDDEVTVKRLHKVKRSVELLPENEKYAPIKLNKNEKMSIIGKVVGVYRSYC